MAEMRFAKAIGSAIADAMRADTSVIVLGEDVAVAGGSFGVTRGLLDAFGPRRIRDTPIAESALVGMGVGAALAGLRPVIEIMFMDFVTLGMDAIVNQAAKAHFMFGGQRSVPMVVRMPHGGGLSAGPQHSQCLEVWFAHVPGVKVACPATPADAYALMRDSIADPNPVIFIENKKLYGMSGDVPSQPRPATTGSASIARAGRDATIVAYGTMVHVACEAAAALAQEFIEVEVIDLRWLQPWDENAVLASLSRTHRLVVAHEAVEAFGVGAEIAARMADVGFDELDAPIVRVGAPFMPVPFAPGLESRFRPDAARIVAAIRRVLE